MGLEQRRSARVMFSIPLKIRGVDSQGQPFDAKARSISLNRHGARVQVSHPLHTGQTLRVINQVNEQEADFRVVGPLSPQVDRLGEWGIECLEPDRNIWDIYFPPMHEMGDAHVLVECRQCHSLVLQSLSLVEVEVLETAGIFSKPCAQCQTSTTWGYPPRVFDAQREIYESEIAAAHGADAPPQERRKSTRKPSQLPARVRDYYGEAEIIQTETVWQEGFTFCSSKNYTVGQGVLTICPYRASNEKPEVRARIIRTEQMGGAEQHLYILRYDQTPT